MMSIGGLPERSTPPCWPPMITNNSDQSHGSDSGSDSDNITNRATKYKANMLTINLANRAYTFSYSVVLTPHNLLM